tara:strand:- start:418 stop:1134 length:717 start_codon:yes stop_codon:yes gene_type:complete
MPIQKISIDLSARIRQHDLFCDCENEDGKEITQQAWAEEHTKGKKLNKPFRTPGGPKKFSVYVKNEKGNVVKVNFGDPNMSIKRDSPERRKSFRARHNCDNPGPKTKARYWSCRQWRAGSKVEGGVLHLDEDQLERIILDELDESEAKGKGLWHNIRQKKKRMGKNYRPAKPGDKDYPDEKSLKKAQKSSKKKKEAKAELTEKQKTLPDAIKKKILEKQGKSPKKDDKEKKNDKEKKK